MRSTSEAEMATDAIGFLALICAGLCGAAASLALKAAASGLPLIRMGIMAGVALAFYGASFLLYAYSLRYFNVALAYICMVAVAALTLLAWSAMRGDGLGLRSLLGVLAILIGIALISGKH